MERKLQHIYPEALFSFNNQLLELEDDDFLKDVIDKDDTITARKQEPQNEDRWKVANLENDSESIVVIINKRSKKPMILRAKSVSTLKLSSLALLRVITVFRYKNWLLRFVH